MPYYMHPGAERARKRILHLIETGSQKDVPNIQFVIGPTHMGKSGLLRTILEDPAFQVSEGKNGILRPILYAEAPHQGTVKGLAEVMLTALGDPHPSRGTEVEMKARIYNYLEGQETRLVIIDEVQQLSRTNLYDYAEFLKTMKNNITCPILCVGLADAIDLCRHNDQLRMRSRPPIELRPLDWRDAVDRKNYRRLLLSFKGVAPDRLSNLPLEEWAFAAAIHITTGGAPGATHNLIRQALDEADIDGDHDVDRTHFERACDGLAKMRFTPLTFNPFTIKKLPEDWAPLPFDHGTRRKKP